MGDQAIAASIPVHERTEALALIHDGGRCYGAVVRDLDHRRAVAYVAKATAIADRRRGTALPRDDQRGDLRGHRPLRIALETGVAALGNMEAVQFHPTGIFPAGILVTEGCRGDGGLLKDVDGHRFMPDYEPEKKELASRDVVSRRMEEHIAQGQGRASRASASTSGSTSRCWASTTSSTTCARSARSATTSSASIRSKDLIPVRPAQHYTMGGVRTDSTGESPTLKGLFAAGEAACWDMHGFNRLGGNSVAETVVAGMIVGEFIADFCDRVRERRRHPDRRRARVPRARAGEARRHARAAAGTEDAAARCGRAMQEIMTAKVGIFRARQGPRAGGGRAAEAAGAQPQHRRALPGRQAPIRSWSRPIACRRC